MGQGIWLYGAATGELAVECLGLSGSKPDLGRYKLTGTGAFRLKPGCTATFNDHIRLPSYVSSSDVVTTNLSSYPIVDVFSLNFSISLWQNMTATLPKPDQYDEFLKHLKEGTKITRQSIDLQEFNNTLMHFEQLRNQLPPYHPLRWLSHPSGQMSGFSFLLVLNIVSVVLLAVWIRRVSHRRLSTPAGLRAPPMLEAAAQERTGLIRVRRRRQTVMEDTV